MSEDFLSGASGQVTGIRAVARALGADLAADVDRWRHLQPLRLRRAARTLPPRRVLTLAVEHDDRPTVLAMASAELRRSRHRVDLAVSPVGDHGKFENLNRLLAEHSVEGVDWLLVLDDDVRLPRGFLDAFLFLAERFELQLAQPAHRHRSHAAWAVTRRQTGAVARESRFVEVGPVFALHRSTFSALLPFPPLRFGWGLDLHWSALAREHGWRQGIVDATPVLHGLRQIAASYDRDAAVSEARQFLADRPYATRGEALQTLRAHHGWRR